MDAVDCVAIDIWDSDKNQWMETGRQTGLKACQMHTIKNTGSGKPLVCQCTSAELNNNKCDTKCNNDFCKYDNGACRECGVLGITNGAVTTKERTLGTKVEFKCSGGFDLSGSSSATCTARSPSDRSGRWIFAGMSKSFPKCGPLPPAPCKKSDLFATLSDGVTSSPPWNQVAATTMDSITFDCSGSNGAGYQLSGKTVAVCDTKQPKGKPGIWKVKDTGELYAEQPISCQKTSCSKIVAGENAELKVLSTISGEDGTYMCDPGYVFEKGSSYKVDDRTIKVTCVHNDADDTATWDFGAPSDFPCTPLDCRDSAYSLKNGKVGFGSLPLKIGAAVQVTCDPSYQLVGASELQCSVSDADSTKVQWKAKAGASAPSCQLVTCDLEATDKTTVSPSAGASGEWSYKDQATFSCPVGYKLAGDDKSALCTENGFVASPSGDAMKKAPACAQLFCDKDILQSKLDYPDGIIFSVPDGSLIVHGDKLNAKCAEGYLVQGSTYQTTYQRECKVGEEGEASGGWDDEVLPCMPKPCNTPDDVDYGTFNAATAYVFNQAVAYTCDPGYGPGGVVRCNTDLDWKLTDGTTAVCCDLANEYILSSRFRSQKCDELTVCKHVFLGDRYDQYEKAAATVTSDRECERVREEMPQRLDINLDLKCRSLSTNDQKMRLLNAVVTTLNRRGMTIANAEVVCDATSSAVVVVSFPAELNADITAYGEVITDQYLEFEYNGATVRSSGAGVSTTSTPTSASSSTPMPMPSTSVSKTVQPRTTGLATSEIDTDKNKTKSALSADDDDDDADVDDDDDTARSDGSTGNDGEGDNSSDTTIVVVIVAFAILLVVSQTPLMSYSSSLILKCAHARLDHYTRGSFSTFLTQFIVALEQLDAMHCARYDTLLPNLSEHVSDCIRRLLEVQHSWSKEMTRHLKKRRHKHLKIPWYL